MLHHYVLALMSPSSPVFLVGGFSSGASAFHTVILFVVRHCSSRGPQNQMMFWHLRFRLIDSLYINVNTSLQLRIELMKG